MSRTPISSDDPQAPEKLQARIDSAQMFQDDMKAINKAHRLWVKKPEGKTTLKAMAELSDKQQQFVKDYRPKFSWEPHPFPPYMLQNNNANISRMQKRLKTLARVRLEDEAFKNIAV